MKYIHFKDKFAGNTEIKGENNLIDNYVDR